MILLMTRDDADLGMLILKILRKEQVLYEAF
jgi:hypothetical protein